MLKRLIQVSSLTALLALGAVLPAAAWTGGSEEDAAAPAGSFTSSMAIPMRADRVSGHDRFFHFGRHHARLDGRRGHRFG